MFIEDLYNILMWLERVSLLLMCICAVVTAFVIVVTMLMMYITFDGMFTATFQPQLRDEYVNRWAEITTGLFPIALLLSLIAVVYFGLRPIKSMAVALSTGMPLLARDWRRLLVLNLILVPYLMLVFFGCWLVLEPKKTDLFWFVLMPCVQAIVAALGWSRTRNTREV
jgi:type IV secretory pathway VirB2 component (pilin)